MSFELMSGGEVSRMLGVGCSTVYNAARRIGLIGEDPVRRDKSVLFDADEIVEIMNAISRELEEPDCVKVSRFANPAEHPLVTDKRCLDFNWWPEAEPECFKNLEMDE